MRVKLFKRIVLFKWQYFGKITLTDVEFEYIYIYIYILVVIDILSLVNKFTNWVVCLLLY